MTGAMPSGGGGTSGLAARPGAPLALQAIAKRYGGVTAVEDVSLEVASGEFVSLLGPSGSGKTTTLMMIAGFILPSAGTILLDGKDITRLAPYRRNIGMVYQNYALFPHMTVGRNVAFPLRMRGAGRDEIERRVARALELVQLRGLAERKPGELSGGQQQRVALARALVFEPPLLLMDEPLGALDKKLREELQGEIKRIQRQTRGTVIYVTHDQEEALSLSDRVVVLNHGRIEQAGRPGELYERPRTRFVAEFLGAANFLEAVVTDAGEHLRARSAGGLELELARTAQAPVGSKLTLSIRPERVLLAPEDGGGGGGTVKGTIVEASYFGNAERYLVRLGGGELLASQRPSTGLPTLPPGTAVRISWARRDVWAIPEGGG